MKTLVVEDDFASRFVLEKIFQIYGECHTAVDGEEGLKAYQMSMDENSDGSYDLICLDIMMPKMGGKELLKQIRGAEENK